MRHHSPAVAAIGRFLARVRRPEYTGANRCLPCTAVNLAIAAAGVGLLWTRWPVVAAAFGVVAVGAIGLRGYLVPGTPALTKRYLPDRVLGWFDHGPERPAAPGATGPIDVVAYLDGAGLVVDDGDDVAVAPSFERDWFARVDRTTDDDAAAELAAMLGVDADRVELAPGPAAFTARVDGHWAGHWESRAAFLADAAANHELARRLPGWEELPLDHRSEVLGGLRACLGRCPVCGGAVELAPGVVESCCRSVDVVASTCRGCDSRLFELTVDPETVAA